MADYTHLLPDYAKGTASTGPAIAPGSGSAIFDYGVGFIRSALESVPELVGIHPTIATQQYRQDHPVAGFMSGLVGYGVPYAGWLKAARMIGPLERAALRIGNPAKTPFLTSAGREALRLAPFEVGRLGVSQVVGDESFGSMLGDVAINTGLGAGLAGVGGLLRAAGPTRTPRRKVIPGVDIYAPTQLQIRQVEKLASDPTTPPELVPDLQFEAARLRTTARTETSPGRYVAPLVNRKEETRRGIDRLFRPATHKGMMVRQFTETDTGFPGTPGLWKGAATNAGLPPNFEDLVQFPRLITFHGNPRRAAKAALKVDIDLGKMVSVGNRWLMAREADDGLFVMARKVTGKFRTGDPNDSWLLFKTDQPDLFATVPARWTQAQVARMKWMPNVDLAADGGVIYNGARNFEQQFPLHNFVELQKPGMVGKLLPKSSSELTRRIGDVFKEFLTPAAHQLKRSPRALRAWTGARQAFDAAVTRTQQLVYGARKVDPARSAVHSILRNTYEKDQNLPNIQDLIESLSKEEVENELYYLWRNKISESLYPSAVAAGKVSANTANVATAINKLMKDEVWDPFVKAHETTGHSTKKFVQGTLGLPREWIGDTGIVIRDEGGKIIGIAGGKTRNEARTHAQEIAKGNPTWRVSEEFYLSRPDSVPKDIRPLLRANRLLGEKLDIRGFKYDTTPWTKEELLKSFEDEVGRKTHAQANRAVEHIWQPEIDRVAEEDVLSHRILTQRLNDMRGIQSEFSRWQNQVVDGVLGPVLGTNSATKIVSVTNSVMWHLQLGALKLSYPIANAMQIIQTVLPEIAFNLSASRGALAGTYSEFAAGGTKGIVGGIGVLNPLKLLGRSFRQLKDVNDKDYMAGFERAVNERVIDPRFAEDFIGQNNVQLRDMKTAISSPGGFVNWLRALSEFMPGVSERFTRGHSFATGWVVGRDAHGIADPDRLYQFAKQFTERTSFMYSAADRPRIFTTPLGSGLGLFKNWMMNYIHLMLEYTQEGITKNNWAPLMWQTAGTFTTAGLAGTPIYWAANAFAEAFTDKSMLQLAYDEWGGDALMFGLPAALSGVSLYSQTASPLANPVRDASMLFGVATLDRAKQLGSLVGNAFDHWSATGEHPGRDPRIRDQLIRTFAPVSIYRVFGAIEDESIRSLATGYKMMDKVGFADRLLYMAGFNPVAYEREMLAVDQLFRDRNARQAAVARLGQALFLAQEAKDSQQMTQIIREATVQGIDVGSVWDSARARRSKSLEDTANRNFRRQDLNEMRNVIGN